MKRSLPLILGAAGLGVVVVAIALFFFTRERSSPEPLPKPNGYDDFAAAGQWIVAWTGDLTKLPPEELRNVLEQNAKALEEARSGLAKESAVPVQFNQNWLSATLMHGAANKQIAQLLVGEGVLHLHEGRTNDAARSFTDCIRFAHAAHRRGLMIHELVGFACQTLGVRQMANIAPSLSPDARKEIIRELLELDHAREPASATIERDRRWSRATFGALRIIWAQLALRDSVRGAFEGFSAKHTRSVATSRLVIMALALRGYEAQHGKPPATLEELVPAWLPALPLDPYTGRPFVYRSNNDSYLLYSVGPDGKDNQGTPMKPGATNNYDLRPGEF